MAFAWQGGFSSRLQLSLPKISHENSISFLDKDLPFSATRLVERVFAAETFFFPTVVLPPAVTPWLAFFSFLPDSPPTSVFWPLPFPLDVSASLE